MCICCSTTGIIIFSLTNLSFEIIPKTTWGDCLYMPEISLTICRVSAYYTTSRSGALGPPEKETAESEPDRSGEGYLGERGPTVFQGEFAFGISFRGGHISGGLRMQARVVRTRRCPQ